MQLKYEQGGKGFGRILPAVFLSVFVLWPGRFAAAADSYQIDSAHSSFGFSVKHLTVSTVTGEFTDYSGTIQFDPKDPSAFMSEVTIKTASIDTRQKERDHHLRSADFFDAEKFPVISFKSKKLTPGSGALEKPRDPTVGAPGLADTMNPQLFIGVYRLTGDLTMHGVTKEISIPVMISGPVKSPMGGEVIGLSGETTINRQDFGISWNKALDSGGWMVGDEVKISVNLEAHKK